VDLDWSQPGRDGRVALPAQAGPVIAAGPLVPSEPGADAARAGEILEEFLLAGTPIALWPEAGIPAGHTVSKVPRRIKALVKGHRPEELPGLVHERRRGRESAADADPLHHLCLLWDDPDRLPPDREERVASPGYATR
jgi:hypothetical protein